MSEENKEMNWDQLKELVKEWNEKNPDHKIPLQEEPKVEEVKEEKEPEAKKPEVDLVAKVKDHPFLIWIPLFSTLLLVIVILMLLGILPKVG